MSKLIFALSIDLPYVLPYITHLLNTIITSSTFPAMWKSAKIIPVSKQDKTYRPIAIFPYLWKIFEKLIYKQMTHYLYGNDVLSEKHSGFRPITAAFLL